jgi:hypothetical protein
LLHDCTNLEIESFVRLGHFLNRYTLVHTHIIKNIYPNPSEIFDEISRDEEIIKEHQV